MDPSWQVPMLDPEDVANFQIQPNLWRRVMAHQVGEKVWRLEFHEATDAYRGFFFQVAFQVCNYSNNTFSFLLQRVLTTCRASSLLQKLTSFLTHVLLHLVTTKSVKEV